jgi:hypothetical protein
MAASGKRIRTVRPIDGFGSTPAVRSDVCERPESALSGTK